jgi:CHAT domain-containing protein
LQQWLLAKMTLGNLYCEPVTGNAVYDSEQAITQFEEMLDHCDPDVFPIRWAEAQNNLGTVYAAQSRRPADKAYQQATACFERASTIRTPETLPDQARRTALNWGNLAFRHRQWPEALRHYETALAAGEVLYQSSVTPAGRRVELAESAGLAANAAYCLLRQQRFDRGLLVLDHGKTRLLAEALALSEANLSVLSAEQQQDYRTAVERVRLQETEFRRLADVASTGGEAGAGARSERDIVTDLTQARADLTTLIETIRQELPDFLPAGLELPQLLDLIPTGGALIAPVVTAQGSAIFVVPHGVNKVEADHILWLGEFTTSSLRELLIGTDGEPGWLRTYLENRSTPAIWWEAFNLALEEITRRLVNPIVDKLTELGVASEASLLIMPQGGLGLLPLHTPLIDDYCVTYAPSGYALHTANRRLRAKAEAKKSLLAVINPTEDLSFAPAEGNTIAALFDPAQVTRLDGGSATLDAVNKLLQPATRRLLHFSGHGFYNWEEALQSGLVLTDGPLTLNRLISQADLGAVRLVTLSACETGITDITQSPDEFLGLPAGLMQAGAPAVVSTLWAVDDLSTLLLMERFYQHYLQEDLSIPEALRQAQIWLRDVSARALVERFTVERQKMLSGSTGLLPPSVISEGYNRFKIDCKPEGRPFAHPFHWAAFTFSGA